jgi:hypothetical protein
MHLCISRQHISDIIVINVMVEGLTYKVSVLLDNRVSELLAKYPVLFAP